MRLLKGGRVPDERQGAVLGMIGKRGSEADLTYIFERGLKPDGFSRNARLRALQALADAARQRRLRPEGDLGRIAELATDVSVEPQSRVLAIELIGLWGQEGQSELLYHLAIDADYPMSIRGAAASSLANLGNAGRPILLELVRPHVDQEIRQRAVAGLARRDLGTAAHLAAEMLSKSSEGENFAGLLEAFLSLREGPQELADALADQQLAADTAKRVLRAMYVLGRADAPLVSVLSKAAGIDAEVKPLGGTEMAELVREIAEKGDASRGEHVFRRADLNCTGCHAIGGAGGDVGPDLGPLGTTSPSDYIVRSIMTPDESIKEQYQTLVVQTKDGQIFQGVVKDRDEQRVVLKQADGTTREVPAADVDDQLPGGSLMPKGLTNLITHDEFVDLVRFLSELGKPGPYAIRATPTLQTWHVFKDLPDSLATPLPAGAILPTPLAEATVDQCMPLLASVSGEVPLAEASKESKNPIVFMKSAVDVTGPGALRFEINDSRGVMLWADGLQRRFTANACEATLPVGRHVIWVRVNVAERGIPALRVELLKPEGSGVQFTVVNGKG